MKFSELFETAANRTEVVCTFLALLELIRLKQITCLQPEPFAEIEISRAMPAEAAASEVELESPPAPEPDTHSGSHNAGVAAENPDAPQS